MSFSSTLPRKSIRNIGQLRKPNSAIHALATLSISFFPVGTTTPPNFLVVECPYQQKCICFFGLSTNIQHLSIAFAKFFHCIAAGCMQKRFFPSIDLHVSSSIFLPYSRGSPVQQPYTDISIREIPLALAFGCSNVFRRCLFGQAT